MNLSFSIFLLDVFNNLMNFNDINKNKKAKCDEESLKCFLNRVIRRL